MMYGWELNAWGWAWMVVMMTGGILLVILLAAILLRMDSRGPQSVKEEDREQVLALRMARGEIGEEEYRRRTALLPPGNGTSDQ